MANPLYDAMHKGGGETPMMRQFADFMAQMRGQNPNDILQQMMSSGRISQQQLDAAQRQAERISGLLGPIRGRFGF